MPGSAHRYSLSESPILEETLCSSGLRRFGEFAHPVKRAAYEDLDAHAFQRSSLRHHRSSAGALRGLVGLRVDHVTDSMLRLVRFHSLTEGERAGHSVALTSTTGA